MEELSQLVRAAQNGDGNAFGQIIGRFQDMAFAGAYAMLGDPHAAQDAAQDAFIDAYLNLSKLREPAAFPGWFRRILFKHGDRQLRRRTMQMVSMETAVSVSSPILDPLTACTERRRESLVEVAVMQHQLHETVQGAIASLPPNQRLAVTLFYIQGYSQKEIAAFLECPITTIKKRLYSARQQLKGKLLMIQENLQQNKPSQNDSFSNKVQFFIALREGNASLIEKILNKQPDWVDLKTEWPIASGSYHWPLGITPLYYAAGLGMVDLMTVLLGRGADVDGAGSNQSPLHHAVLLGEQTAVKLLLDHEANINAMPQNGLTPLHYAIIRQNEQIAALLLTEGADVGRKDKSGRTPMDWAVEKGFDDLVDLLVKHGAKRPKSVAHSQMTPEQKSVRRIPKETATSASSVQAVLGRIIDGSGKPMDGGTPISLGQPLPVLMAQSAPAILETGVKIIDLMAPIKRGGHIGVFTPLSGIGRLYTQDQIMYSIMSLHDGFVVYLGLEHGAATAASLHTSWRANANLPEAMLNERIVSVFGHVDDSTAAKQQIAETGLAIAEGLRRQGKEVLLMVQNKMTHVEGVVQFLRGNTAVSPNATITTIYDGDHTAGLEPTHFTDLDGVITFERARGKQGLWPAVDPLRSCSKLLTRPDLIGVEHVETVTAVHKLFQRYQGLHDGYEYAGFDALFYLDNVEADETAVIRARRLHRFLTQPLPMAELFTGKPGQLVSLTDTIQTSAAILKGKYDNWAEEKFYFIGALE